MIFFTCHDGYYEWPVLVGLAATFSDDPKYVLLTLLPLFIVGALLLRQIPAAAEQMDRSAHSEHPGS